MGKDFFNLRWVAWLTGITLLALASAVSSFAQDAPTVKYSGAGKNRRVTEMSNMLGEVEYMECKRAARLVTGKIVKRDYEEDEFTIASFVVADARDKRFPINLNEATVGVLGHDRNGLISSLLTKGNRVQVWFHECSGGGSGIFFYANRIKVL